MRKLQRQLNLFENAGPLLARLRAEEPFATGTALLARARTILNELSEAEQIAVINAHPRIGERPDTVSVASFREQGYDRDTTPPEVLRQRAAAIVLGSILGLTPLINLHTAVIFAALVLLNVSFAGGLRGWAVFVPVGFLLDPLFDWIGHILLLAPSLRGLWTSLSNTPIIPLTNFNNTVVLGSLVFAMVFALPLF